MVPGIVTLQITGAPIPASCGVQLPIHVLVPLAPMFVVVTLKEFAGM
jgi:hypothetical protein